MQKYKSKHIDGIEIRTLDLQATDGRLRRAFDWTMENSIEIIMLALFVGMVVAMGMLMSTTAQAVDLAIEYVEEQDELMEGNYQLEQVLKAIEKRAEETPEVHPVTGAEMPPYWTAPEESY